MEVEVEIEHVCPCCGYVWITIELVNIEPPEREEDDR
jgi:hypothetical protein